MIDRRGHKKLQLTSRKHFKLKPKPLQTKDVTGNEVPCPQADKLPCPPEGLTICLPVSSYVDSPLTAVDELHGRFGSIPSGMELLQLTLP